jgi:lysophospholipase L1-like esterase
LANAIKIQFDPVLLVHSAVPPMEHFTAMPQPLRWLMGAWAAEMNRQLLQVTGNDPDSLVHAPFASRAPGGLADDGFHPGPLAYQVWAESLTKEIVEKFGSGLVAH